MPIKIPSKLPAYQVLKREGVYVMSHKVAKRQDIRPLQIGLLNLMPKKIQTETQFARLIGTTPLQIELTLIRITAHRSKTTSSNHLEAFYTTFAQVKKKKFDGLIITGAPIEHLPYSDVTYWQEMLEIFNWTQTNVHSTFAVCWGAMAMLYHFYRIEKRFLKNKAFGCFQHEVLQKSSPYLQGFSDVLIVPISRWTEIYQKDINKILDLITLIHSDKFGPCLVEDKNRRALYVFNHFEYDSDTLKQEYDRDNTKGTPINIPQNYYQDNDPKRNPINRWRSHGHLLYGNWINQIYQTTPYILDDIGVKIHQPTK